MANGEVLCPEYRKSGSRRISLRLRRDQPPSSNGDSRPLFSQPEHNHPAHSVLSRPRVPKSPLRPPTPPSVRRPLVHFLVQVDHGHHGYRLKSWFFVRQLSLSSPWYSALCRSFPPSVQITPVTPSVTGSRISMPILAVFFIWMPPVS